VQSLSLPGQSLFYILADVADLPDGLLHGRRRFAGFLRFIGHFVLLPPGDFRPVLLAPRAVCLIVFFAVAMIGSSYNSLRSNATAIQMFRNESRCATLNHDCRVESFEWRLTAALRDKPAFSDLFIAYLLGRNSRIEGDLIDQLFNSSEKRLARLLLLLANFSGDGNTQLIDAKFSQETLAEMIGTTRSRVSHFMNKFRKLGFIDYNGTIEIHRSLMNALLHDKLPTS
jgi:hypothetical protein